MLTTLNVLTPRDVNKLTQDCAMFVLFTTPDGTVDHERVLTFSHLAKTCRSGDTLTDTDGQEWMVRPLPFD